MNTRTVLLWHNNGAERIYFAVNPSEISVSRPNRNRVASLAMGGTACAVLNAANEVAAQAFLKDRIRMGAVYRVVAGTLERLGASPADSLEAVLEADRRAREMADELLKKVNE